MTFVKNDGGKLRWSLLPLDAVREVVWVLQHGADKYGADNWRNCDNWDRIFDAMMRHIVEWRHGVHSDSETGRSHLAHAAACAIMLIWAEERGKI
jgi:hypothetical protein